MWIWLCVSVSIAIGKPMILRSGSSVRGNLHVEVAMC